MRGGSPVEIEGVGDLPITLARCCAPIRPQPIVGYVTVGRGVTIHRRGCASFTRMCAVRPERVNSLVKRALDAGDRTRGIYPALGELAGRWSAGSWDGPLPVTWGGLVRGGRGGAAPRQSWRWRPAVLGGP